MAIHGLDKRNGEGGLDLPGVLLYRGLESVTGDPKTFKLVSNF